MQTVNPRGGSLCNWEVLQFLRQQRRERRALENELPHAEAARRKPESLVSVEHQCIQYLECPEVRADILSESAVKELVAALAKYDLTKMEKMMLVNHLPQDISALSCCIEEIDERLPSDDDKDAILDIIASFAGDAGAAQPSEQHAVDSAPLSVSQPPPDEDIDDGQYDEQDDDFVDDRGRIDPDDNMDLDD